MATYKVPQNVEAEDKLLGPFTFKQFIFLMIAAMAVFIAWLLSRINPWLIIIPLPIILAFGFLGVYRREDQPVEIYLLAALNYLFKPKQRKWDPEGVVENVRLIAPKAKPTPELKRLSGQRGQLDKLAHIMDTRGWAVKRPELTEPLQDQALNGDDRLVIPNSPPQAEVDVHVYEDQLDPYNFSDAQKYADLAATTTKQARSTAISKMRQAIKSSSGSKTVTKEQAVAKSKTKSLPGRVKYQPYPEQIRQTVIEPRSGQVKSKKSGVRKKDKGRAQTPKVVELANNNEVPVSEIAKQAQKLGDKKQTDLEAGQEIDLPND